MRSKQTFQKDIPGWAIRSDRAIEELDLPSLRSLQTEVFDRMGVATFLLIVRPLVAVLVFIASATQGWWLLAVPSVWFVYGSTLTAVHHLIHSSLGLSARGRRFWLRTLGLIVMESGHALQVTHLAHHRSNTDVPDPEGYIENVTWAQLPLAALQFRYRLALWGLRNSPRPRRVAVELAVHAIAHIASLALLPFSPILWIYLSLTHVASFVFAVLAGKGPQTNWGRPVHTPLVRVQTRLGRILFFSHDQHLEHHAYPKVPLFRLRRLHPELNPEFAKLDVINVEMRI